MRNDITSLGGGTIVRLFKEKIGTSGAVLTGYEIIPALMERITANPISMDMSLNWLVSCAGNTFPAEALQKLETAISGCN